MDSNTGNIIDSYKNAHIIAGIDLYGQFKQLFEQAIQIPGYLFVLCMRGTCNVKIHLTHYEMRPRSLAIIYPEAFFRMNECDTDCRLLFVGFPKELVHTQSNFTHTIEYVHYIMEQPVVGLERDVFRLFHDYFILILRSMKTEGVMDERQVSLAFSQIITTIGNIYKRGVSSISNQYSRNEEIAKELLRVVIQHYKSERNVTFYAQQLHLSPQHLSTTIKKTTGKTLTEIISSLIIHDAKAKLRSTELTVQEIAYSLNFSDISFFGKYFKRYTGMSPKQYRNTPR